VVLTTIGCAKPNSISYVLPSFYSPNYVTNDLIELVPKVIIIHTKDSQGSCVLIAKQDGRAYFSTANHCLGDELTVSGDAARVEFANPAIDLAIISTDVNQFQFIDPVPISYPIAGEAAVLVGWTGVSSKGMTFWRGHVVTPFFDGWVLFNGGCYPGCSGGGLFNEKHELIGITSHFLSTDAYRDQRELLGNGIKLTQTEFLKRAMHDLGIHEAPRHGMRTTGTGTGN